jgi:hypothetical protein
MKIEAQLIEIAAWRGELANILLAIAAVILFGIVTAMIQERRPGITRRAIGWLSLSQSAAWRSPRPRCTRFHCSERRLTNFASQIVTPRPF